MSSSFLLVSLALSGCFGGAADGSGPAAPATAIGAVSSSERASARIELRLDETVEDRDLELRWLDLQDSRCPTGVQCIRAGRVVATVEVTRGQDEPMELELVLQARGDPPAARAFGYKIVLRSVEPYPANGVTPERSDYVAVVEITGP